MGSGPDPGFKLRKRHRARHLDAAAVGLDARQRLDLLQGLCAAHAELLVEMHVVELPGDLFGGQLAQHARRNRRAGWRTVRCRPARRRSHRRSALRSDGRWRSDRRRARDRRWHRRAAWQNSNPMPTVLVSLDAGVLTITLNRPEKLNALNPEMHGGLRAALERAKDEPEIRALLLTGAGRGFCTGQDLAERDAGAAPIDLSVSLGSHYNPLVRRLRSLPKPIVCAVNGVAAGAGANLALACDLVIAARSASFVQAFSRLGLVPDSGGTFFLPRLVGTARAMGLALLAEPLTAERAEQW